MKHERNAVRRQYTAQFYKNNHTAFVISLAFSVLIAALNLWIVWVIQQIIDSVSGVPGALGLPALAVLVVGVIAAIVLLKTVDYFSKPRFIEKAMRQYKDYAFRRLTQKSITAFREENTSQYLSAFSNDAATIETGYLETQFEIIVNTIMLLGSLGMMIAYSPVMTVVACAFFALPIAVSLLTGKRIEKAERAVSEKNAALVAALKDCLSGFSVVKSFKAEKPISQMFAQSSAAAEQAKCDKRKLTTIIGANVRGCRRDGTARDILGRRVACLVRLGDHAGRCDGISGSDRACYYADRGAAGAVGLPKGCACPDRQARGVLGGACL